MSSAYGMHDERLAHAPPGSAQRKKKGGKGKKKGGTSEGDEGGRTPPAYRDDGVAAPADEGGNAGGGGGGSPQFNSNGGGIGIAVQSFTLFSVLMQFLVFLLHTIHLLNTLDDCKQNDDGKGEDDDAIVCFGDALYWENDSLEYKTYNSNLNRSWRGVFTFAPDTFADNWTPAVFFLIAVLQLSTSMRWTLLYNNWLVNAFFHLVMLLFAAMGYAGKFGVAAGMVHAVTGFLALVAFFLTEPGVCYFTIYHG